MSTLPLLPNVVDLESDEILCRKLAGLQYPGFAYLPDPLQTDATDVLIQLIGMQQLDPRLLLGIPWLLAYYVKSFNWKWLVAAAIEAGSQNRLGYFVHLARVAGWPPSSVDRLAHWEAILSEKRSPVEDTCGQANMSKARRSWLLENRPAEAAYWRVLTNLTIDDLKLYAFE